MTTKSAWDRLLPKDKERALAIARERGIDMRWRVTLGVEVWDEEVEVEVEAVTADEAEGAAVDITDLDDFNIQISVESTKRLDPDYNDELEKIAEEIVGVEREGQTKLF